jgi:hypothetical protein
MIMPSKSRESRETQKAYWESQRDLRLSDLAERDLDQAEILKDPALRKIKAQIRAADFRLRAIAALEAKQEQMKRTKDEKQSAPKEDKGKKKATAEEEPHLSKRQQKKQDKKKAKTEGEKEGS